MTNDELRRKVAILHGYQRQYGIMDETSTQEHEYWIMPEGWKTVIIPNYPGEIAAAWELVEEMINNRKRPKIVRVAENEWYAGVDHNSDYFGFADTAPRAICLAYIAWREAKG